MTPRQALTSLLHFFVVFFFFSLGCFFVLLPFLPEARYRLVDFLVYEFEFSTKIGLAFFALTFLLFIPFYLLEKGRYLWIQMGKRQTGMELKMVRHAVEGYFQGQFPEISLIDLGVNRGSFLEMKVRFKEEAHQESLLKLEKDLALFLEEQLGYSRTFHIVVKR